MGLVCLSLDNKGKNVQFEPGGDSPGSLFPKADQGRSKHPESPHETGDSEQEEGKNRANATVSLGGEEKQALPPSNEDL